MNFGYVTEKRVNSNVRDSVTALFYGISICKKIETEVKGGLQMGVSMKFTDLDQYLFGQGTNYEVYKKLGAHPTTYRRKKGVYFAVWAPNAQSVSVIGEFNDWEEEANPMEKVGPIGVYEVFIPGAKIGQLYKFFIVGAHGEKLYKADPYANEAELRPGTASRITDITDYK